MEFYTPEKNEGNLGTLFTIMVCQINNLVPTYFFLNILCDHCLHALHLYIRKMLKNREMVNFKNGTFSNFLYAFTMNCVTTGARKIPIEYMVCFFLKRTMHKNRFLTQ